MVEVVAEEEVVVEEEEVLDDNFFTATEKCPTEECPTTLVCLFVCFVQVLFSVSF